MKNLLVIFITLCSLTVSAIESFPMYNPVHNDKFNPLTKIDYHIDFFTSEMVEYAINGKEKSVETRVIVYPHCFYVAKFNREFGDTVGQYCGAILEEINHKRYRRSGLDENGYWDMRKTDDNPDNESSYRFNFHLEKNGKITFNLVRYLHTNVILYSCEQLFNTENYGVAKNPIPTCKLEGAGRKGRKLQELYDQFSPKQYWKKLDITSD